MNCNDFTSTYNIGVMDIPYVQFGTDWTGVARVQGREDLTPIDKVRNTYACSVPNCVGNMENKFHIDALNNNVNNYFYVNRHGSFTDPQFQPIPQTNEKCSNSGELVNLVLNPAHPEA